MRFRHKRREEEESEINITPMMDIVFIMLIFFIVTTSFIKETGIDPNRPEAETAKRAELGNILIAIAPNDRIWIKRNCWAKFFRAKVFLLEESLPVRKSMKLNLVFLLPKN